jgi:acyl-coenzyme A synthetase/AMP-(fatty) acid ligase/thioester reductase-like protein
LEDVISVFADGEYELVTETFAHGRKLRLGDTPASQSPVAVAFTEAAQKYASHIALETENESFTYAELYLRAKDYAEALTAKVIGAGDIVSFCLPRTAEAIIAQLGIILSGAALLPLDPKWPPKRREFILSEAHSAKVPPDTAYILYTSGTTGRPKGSLIPQSALANQIAWALDEFGFAPGDKMLHYINFTFDPSVWVIFTALAAGATLSLVAEDARLDPAAVARHIIEKNITVATLPAAIAPDILPRIGRSKLRTVFLGGEVPKNLPATGDFEIINCYGPTEACINTTFYRLPSGETETRNIGRPVANTSCYILDKKGGPCPVGIKGELYIGGMQLAHCYLNRPDESATAFVEHQFFGRLYKTGDHATWNNDGTITFYGRVDNQVKIRGNRVELGEIEYALCELENIADAKVKLNDGMIDAYVISERGDGLDISGIREGLAKKLPAYMLPRSVIIMEVFPLNENGKVDYKALPMVSATASEETEPLNEIENTIATAWKTALGLKVDFPVKRADDFSALGGHSLLLFRVVGLLSAKGVIVDIKTLIEQPVLKDLALAIGRRKDVSVPKAKGEFIAAPEAYQRYVKRLENISLKEKREFRNILISGGTGFLGSYLIREFYDNTDADIYLPIRDENIQSRISEVLGYYFGKAAKEMLASGRLHIVPCNISTEVPIIDAPLDAIYHAAADIRHYAKEAEMYQANVTATKNMLALAKMHPGTLFAHISSTSAVNAPIIHECDFDLGPDFENIYQRTKQLAEQHILDAGKGGLKYAVFRVGHVSPGWDSGSVARNWEINAMLRLINSMLLTGILPEQDYEIGYGYVDKVALAIRLLSEPLNLTEHIFHIDNSNTLRLSELFKLAGLTGTILKKAELIEKLSQLAEADDQAVRQAAAEYLGRLMQGSLEKDSQDVVQGKLRMDATLLLLKRLEFAWPHVTAEYMQRIVKNLRNKGGFTG